MLHHSEVFDSVRLTVTLAIAPIKLFLVELLSLCSITNALALIRKPVNLGQFFISDLSPCRDSKLNFISERIHSQDGATMCAVILHVLCSVQLLSYVPCILGKGEMHAISGGAVNRGTLYRGSMAVYVKRQWSKLY